MPFELLLVSSVLHIVLYFTDVSVHCNLLSEVLNHVLPLVFELLCHFVDTSLSLVQMCQSVVKTGETTSITKGCVAPTECSEECPEESSKCTTCCTGSLCNTGTDQMNDEPGIVYSIVLL